MTYSDIKQKPATRAGQCFEVSASALIVFAPPPDSHILMASRKVRNSINPVTPISTGRTPLAIPVRVKFCGASYRGHPKPLRRDDAGAER